MSVSILVAEDEIKLARLIEDKLHSESYVVDVVPDGKQALDRILSTPYDLLILDLMLPVYNGTEVLQEVRSRNMNIPILILTARDSESDKIIHFNAGADDYLTKPFSFAEMAVRVKALLKRAPTYNNPILQIGDVELDRMTHQVRRAGNRINLSAKEYALLEYLMVNAGKVVSRDMIMQSVWDESFENVTNIVDVYIRQLRHKIDSQYKTKLIRTVRGIGYAVNVPPA